MRIGMVTHNFRKGGGHARVNYEIARRLLASGHQTTLVACDVSPDLHRHRGLTWIPVSESALPTQLARGLVFATRSARWLRKHRGDVDVLHVNGYVTDVGGDLNTAHFVHGAWLRSPLHTVRIRRDPYGVYQWLYTALHARLELTAYLEATSVVAVSERVRRQLIGIGVPAARIRVVLNGVDLSEFHPGRADRRDMGLPPDVPLGVFVGDITLPLKNLDTVLRALRATPDLHLAVVGSTERSPYPLLSRRLGVADRVHFLGFRRDVAEIMRCCDMFVFPSRSEACPLVLFEALASGLPVVVAATVGASEIVTSECGYVIDDPNDVRSLSTVLAEMCGDPSRRLQMAGAARAVAEHYSWDVTCNAYLALYEELASR